MSVRRVSSNEPRDFSLPLSGAYRFGVIRLAVERWVTVPGPAAPVPAIVWQRERLARSGQPSARRLAAIGGEVLAHLDDLISAFIDN